MLFWILRLCTSLAISLLITQVVWAEPAPSNSKLSMLPTSCVWMDVVGFIAPQPVITERAILVDRGALTVISPALRGRALLNEHWLISASLPFAATFLSQFPELGSTRIGNPSVDGAYVVELGIRTWLSFGGGVALPVASVPETASADSASNAYRLGRAVRGGATSWELAPDRLTLYFPFAVESGTEYLRVGAEMILWHGFDTSGSGSGNGLPALIGVWIRALALPGVSVGARIKMQRWTGTTGLRSCHRLELALARRAISTLRFPSNHSLSSTSACYLWGLVCCSTSMNRSASAASCLYGAGD